MDFGGAAMRMRGAGEAGLDLTSWYLDIPVVSRLYVTGVCLTAAGCALNLISPLSLSYNFDLIFHRGQLWRLVTTYLFFGKFSLDFLFRMYFLLRYCRMLEEGDFRGRTAHLVTMLLFGVTCMTAVAPFVGVPFLGSALSCMLVYVWSRRSAHARVSFLGVLTVRAPYLPWVMLAFSLLLGHAVTVDVLGILVGHTYYFLEYVCPTAAEIRGWRTKKLLEPPRLLHWICGTYREPVRVHQD